jgi:hypothetical protein
MAVMAAWFGISHLAAIAFICGYSGFGELRM